MNNFKLYQQYQLQSNAGRADWFVQSFVNGTDWADEATMLERASKVTKEQVVALARTPTKRRLTSRKSRPSP